MSDSDQDSRFYRERGIGGVMGFGLRPAVLVVDMQVGFTDPESPLGSNLDGVIQSCQALIQVARSKRIPVIFTVTVFERDLADAGIWIRKIPGAGILKTGSRWAELDARLEKEDTDLVLRKRCPSAFFGTPLVPILNSMTIDTVIVCGCTTSGCVRATCTDVVQYGYRGIVPQDCVGDRAEGPHRANLFDIHHKCCDVMPLAAVLASMT